MNMRLVYQIHKWLAALVLIVTLAWFVSGAVMVMPERWLTLSPGIRAGEAESRVSDAPAFERATVTPSAAVAAVNGHLGRTVGVTGVRLRRLPGRLAYELTTERDGRYFVDALDSGVFTITPDMAVKIVEGVLGPSANLGTVAVQRESTIGYGGPLPAFRVPVNDGKGTVLFVDAGTGQVRLTDSLSRVAQFVMGLHVLSVLRWVMPESVVRALMIVLAISGIVMSVAGAVILVSQFRRWWRRSGRLDPRAAR